MRGHRFVWHGKMQRIRLDPHELPFAIWRIAPAPSVRRERRRKPRDRTRRPPTIRSGTRTRSSISCTSSRSSTANNDGIGDFPGLIAEARLHRELGVNTIWLLPFYPSPLRDDGYDIADYRAVHPDYGTMRDFRRFIAAAHARGIRVITELVINHTSDQHPWFQRARRAKPGSAARDFYVWSDTDQSYAGTRIIFLDTEKSNWTWDPVAQRLFLASLLFAPARSQFRQSARASRRCSASCASGSIMGVDGLRLDAVPYLIEREGTNNENLPETHDVLKRIRAELDAHYPGPHAARRGQPVAGGHQGTISARATNATWRSTSR